MGENNTIEFGKINLNNGEQKKPDDFSKKQNNEKKSIIAQANENINTGDNSNEIKLENIKIDTPIEQKNKKFDFNYDWNKKSNTKKHYHINYRKTFIISFSIIVISILGSIGLNMYNNYLKSYNNNEYKIENNNGIISQIKNFLNLYIKSDNNIESNLNTDFKVGKQTITNYLNSDINYIQAKITMTDYLDNLSNTIILNHKKLDKTKKSITKNGFFPEEISNLINEKKQIGSIQNSLLSLESIKFSSAISVFSNLNTFLDSISNSINISKQEISKNMDKIIKRGNKDIDNYLKSCYLNPFETNYNCNNIGDFDRYYSIINETGFNTTLFKKIIYYIDLKLEQTELPSFSIIFKEFDQTKDELTFNININTFKQDEIELAKNGILSPHIFIYTNLINNLKQSKFIVGGYISTKNIDINPKTVTIGETEFNMNNSSQSFTLPIQKESEREIFDFVETKD